MTKTYVTQESVIPIGETDARGHLTLPALAERLQELAWQHSVECEVDVPRLLQRGVSWVLSRLRIDIFQPPIFGDVVRGSTWLSAIDKYFYHRQFQYVAAYTGQPLLTASSVWGVLDVASRRVVPVPDFIREKTAVHPGHALPDGPMLPHRPISGKLTAPDAPTSAIDVTARWSDLDQNRHVNNTRYVAWLLDALPADVLAGQQLATFDVQFRAEAVLGQTLRSEAGAAEGATFRHAIRAGNTALVLAQTGWRSQ